MIKTHLSLVLVDGFLQSQHRPMSEEYDISVTILILVDGFLQSEKRRQKGKRSLSQSLF